MIAAVAEQPLCINKLCFTHYTERRRKTKREARKEALTADKRGDSIRRQQKDVGFFQLILSAKRGGMCLRKKWNYKIEKMAVNKVTKKCLF